MDNLTPEQQQERLDNANDLEISYLINDAYSEKGIYAVVVAYSEDGTDIEIRTDIQTIKKKYSITLEDQFVSYENGALEMFLRLDELCEEAKLLSILI